MNKYIENYFNPGQTQAEKILGMDRITKLADRLGKEFSKLVMQKNDPGDVRRT